MLSNQEITPKQTHIALYCSYEGHWQVLHSVRIVESHGAADWGTRLQDHALQPYKDHHNKSHTDTGALTGNRIYNL